ncbi:HIRA interacting protein Hip3 [Schizosaccharomyces japonicus yFS275]|uniref:HIRA interacting protein Hip3 n=1 Tax=Schizosaccharomyces japonicus (strain yFS275 / FY16936) TaxID=402676 RepID=B6JWY9_SCHJY|nr:HIRA interacting protein Hip3 [Schizosaccharomyces japonicus yFS275]EEB05890.1 HIRA interacting protein Hip3 [Schizosaccharomyces japonicus yFS275]
MATFTPLNVTSEELDKEKRTLEIRIEEALQLYQVALSAQQRGSWDTVSKLYDKLLNISVIRNYADIDSLVAQKNNALLMLHHLVRKNHGLFLLDRCRSRPGPDGPTAPRGLCIEALSEFAFALACDPNDIQLWSRVSELLQKLRLPRLYRYSLESSLGCAWDSADSAFQSQDLMALNPEKIHSLYLLNQLHERLHLPFPYRHVLSQFRSLYTFPSHFPWLHAFPESASQLLQPSVPVSLSLRTNDFHGLLDLLQSALESVWSSKNSRLGSIHIIFSSIPNSRETSVPVKPKTIEHPVGQTIQSLLSPLEPASTVELTRKRSSDDLEGRSTKRSRVRDLRDSGNHSCFTSVYALLYPCGFQGLIQQKPDGPYFFETIDHNYELFNDYRQILLNFPSQETANDSESEAEDDSFSAIGEFSRMMFFDLTMSNAPRLEQIDVSDPYLNLLINKMNAMRFSVPECAVFFILTLLTPREENAPLYLTQCWGKSFRMKLTSMILRLEYVLYNIVCKSLDNYITLHCAQSIFELFLDDYFMTAKGRSGMNHEELILAEALLTKKKSRCIRWQQLALRFFSSSMNGPTLEILHLQLRHHWATNLLGRIRGYGTEVLAENYTIIRRMFVEGNITLEIPNCQCMSEINADVIDFELSKLETMDFFNILSQNTKKLDYSAVISNLEPVLLGDNVDSRTVIITQFLKKSATAFQLHLWQLLREAYVSHGQPQKALYCMTKSIEVLFSRLTSTNFQSQETDRRQPEVLKLIGCFMKLVDGTWDSIGDTSAPYKGLTADVLRELLTHLLLFLKLFGVFTIVDEEIAEGKLPQFSSPDFKNYAVTARGSLMKGWCLFYRVLESYLALPINSSIEANKVLPNLLTTLHAAYGVRGYCAQGKYCFLKLSQLECQRIDPWENENEILQCLHCRFGFQISSEYYVPTDHGAQPMTLTPDEIYPVIPFVLGFAVRKTHGWIMPRADQKNTLESICETVGPPDESVFEIYANHCAVESFFDSPITRKSVNCLLNSHSVLILNDVPLEKVNLHVRSLYYAQAQILLGHYRSRGKGTGCIPDLLNAVEYCLMDLYINPYRQDGWYTCAALYSAIVEEELSWSAERIHFNIDDIANYQRRAILCYLFAISLPFNDTEYRAKVFFDAGMAIYSAATQPTPMLAFQLDQDRVCSGSSGVYVTQTTVVDSKCAFSIAADLFLEAASIKEQWLEHYMAAKSCAKIKDSKTALHHFVKAAALVPEKTGTGAQQYTIIEPHYSLVSYLGKVVLSKDIDLKQAVVFARKFHHSPEVKPSFLENPELDFSERDFLSYILECLRVLRKLDSKHWYHRPVYRIAKLLEHFGNIEGAKEEMESLFSIRSTVKGLLNIWRPTYERAGRHFYYAAEYTKYLIYLTRKTDDVVTLKQLLKRFRRSAPSVLDHKQIWIDVFGAFLREFREQNHIAVHEPPSIQPSHFNIVLSAIEKLNESAFDTLRQIAELRRLNNSLYPTVEVDDLLIDCFMILYDQCKKGIIFPALQLPETEPVPNANGKRESKAVKNAHLSRKELVSKIMHLTQAAAKESAAKDSPSKSGSTTPTTLSRQGTMNSETSVD